MTNQFEMRFYIALRLKTKTTGKKVISQKHA